MEEYNILIADDDDDDYHMLRDVFTELTGHHISHIHDGQKLLLHLRYLENHHEPFPNLILLDINMPIMNGIKTLQLIRESGSFNHIPVIMHSTTNDEKQKETCLELGANGFVTKAYNYSELLSFVNSIHIFLKEQASAPHKYFCS